MKLGIIGLGYVGSAIANAHSHHELVLRDPRIENSASIAEFDDCDGIFICVPSPSTSTGKCDSSILESVLSELSHLKNIPLICKTTAPPSVYQNLQSKYPNIVHCPEFLTAANHIADYSNAPYFIIGGNKPWTDKAIEIIRAGVPKVNEYFISTDIKSAALYKYMMNCYLATKVTFMNDFYHLAKKQGIDWKEFKNLSVFDDRIGYTHMDVPGPDGKFGWGGACFPKDISAIIEEGLTVGIDLPLLGRVEEINRRHRK